MQYIVVFEINIHRIYSIDISCNSDIIKVQYKYIDLAVYKYILYDSLPELLIYCVISCIDYRS